MASRRQPVFALHSSIEGARAVVALQGDLDIAAEERICAALDRAAATDPAVVVIDMRALSFIDSTGIRVLVREQRRCREASRRLALVPASPAVHRTLVMCGLGDAFELLADAGAPIQRSAA